MASCVHNDLCEDGGSAFFLQECAVDETDGFESDGEGLAECEELEVYLRELDVELLEIRNIFREELLEEVRLDELSLQSVLRVTQQRLVSVQTDLILLHVGVYQHHRLNLVVYAVSNKVIFKYQLFSKDKPKVNFSEQLINIRFILSN